MTPTETRKQLYDERYEAIKAGDQPRVDALTLALDQTILDCGHVPSEHSELTTGTAHTADDREICWTCADAEQRADLLTERKYTAYANSEKMLLTTWTGGELARITSWSRSRHAWTSDGYIYHFWAKDAHGQRWYGTTPGNGMYARMIKAKEARTNG